MKCLTVTNKWNEPRVELSTVKWSKVAYIANMHIGGGIGMFYLVCGSAKFYSYLWTFVVFMIGGIGLAPGCHRLFSHRSYKATRAFKIFLLFCHTVAGQWSAIFWSQIHRSHHKFTDTERDPTNIKRGFWFSHVYWPCKFTPECKKAMDEIDVSDLTADDDIVFQHNHIDILNALMCVLLPTLIPWLLWSESFCISFFANEFRWLLNYNQTGFANSFMHMFGTKPYDRTITAAGNLICILFTFGEGYHNFHHAFPWDYRAAEVGDLLHFNVSAVFLDVCAWLGFVYDRKIVTPLMIERRKAKTGDYLTSTSATPLWGYGDVDMDAYDRKDLRN